MRLEAETTIRVPMKVSIHASVKDATSSHSRSKRRLLSFNPRICKRCDRQLGVPGRRLLRFNPRICKRCDFAMRLRFPLWFCFNPRICKRCDEFALGFNPTQYVSIHASVKDATHVPQLRIQREQRFNPRICKRCDDLQQCLIEWKRVSIHASVKDATPNPVLIDRVLGFQSTHL